MKKVTLALSSNKPTHDWTIGRQILEVLYDENPELRPERIGRDETEMRKKLPCDHANDVQAVWAKFDDYIEDANIVDGLPDEIMFPVYWKRISAVKSDGYFNFASYHKVYQKALPSRLVVRSKHSPKVDFLGMFRSWCEIYEPDQGYLHYISAAALAEERSTKDMMSSAGETERHAKDFQNGFLGPLHQEKTFDLGSVNFFSDQWLGEKAKQDLLSSELNTEPLANGVLISLSQNIDHMEKSFDDFVRLRRLAKTIIGPDKFQIPD